MDVERRSLLKGLAAGLTGAVAASPAAEARSEAPGTSSREPQQASSPSVTPGLLDSHQRATLASLAELILPGSVGAGTIECIDRVAAVEAPAAQRRLLNAIARFDYEARSASGGRWLDLSDAARLEIVTRAAEGAPGQAPQPPWTPGNPIPPPTPVSPPPATTLRDHLDVLKAAIGSAFATTESGMKALGWAGRSSWRELPGCPAAGADE
jgi:gluconate 2-dehydrogenase subunit 3-like protein